MTKTYNDRWIGWDYKTQSYCDFDTGEYIELKDLKPELYVMEFGKCEGMNLRQLEWFYIDWLKENQSPNSLLVHCLNNL